VSSPLRTTLTSVETPDDVLNQRFGIARARLTAEPKKALSIQSLVPALLAIGDHGGALDRLRAARAEGGPIAEALAFYAMWTGDERWLARLAGDATQGMVGQPGMPGYSAEAALALWRAAPSEPDAAMAADLVRGIVEGLWHVLPDARQASVAIAPALPDDWNRMALRQLRIGETLLDLVVRRTRSGVAVTVVRNRGPGLRLTLTLPGFSRFEVDGEQLGGGRAAFRVEGEHEVAART
jgi:hypothetical protein